MKSASGNTVVVWYLYQVNHFHLSLFFFLDCCIMKGRHTWFGRVASFDQPSSKTPTKLAACSAIIWF